MEKRALRNRKVSERMAVVDEADRRRVRAAAAACLPPVRLLPAQLSPTCSPMNGPLLLYWPSFGTGDPGAAGGAGG